MSKLVATSPDTLIAFLEAQGARCGDGIEPRVLTECPVESFCWLDGEEVCVVGPSTDACTASAASFTAPAGAAVALEPVASARELTTPAASGASELSAVTIALLVLAGVALAHRRRDHHVFSPDHLARH